MNSATVTDIGSARERSRRVARVIDARRRLDGERHASERRGGRAWVNGGELGGRRAAFAHLSEIYD